MTGSNSCVVGWRRGGLRAALMVTTALTASAVLAAPAHAGNWTAGTGDWFEPTNWDSGVPTGGDYVTVDNAGTVEVQAPGAVSLGATFGFNSGTSGTAEVSGSGAGWINTYSIYLGYYGTGTLTVSDGASVTTRATYVGFMSTGHGTLNVDGEDSLFDSSASYFTVGNQGEGYLSVTNGGTVKAGTSFIGAQGGGYGSVVVDGLGSQWLTTWGLTVGDFGEGHLEVTNGAQVSAQDIGVGTSSGGSGSVVVDGEGSVLEAAQSFTVGGAGTGTLDITNGGAVRSTTQSAIAWSPGSSGRVTVDGEGSSWIGTSSLYVGASGDGVLEITNGGRVESGSFSVATLFDSTGSVTVDGENSTLDGGESIYLGQFGDATLSITNGGTVRADNVQAGSQDAGSATILVDGAGSSLTMTLGNSSMLGFWGEAVLTVSNGGSVVSSGQLRLAETADSSATVNIGAAAGEDATAAGTFAVDSINFGAGDAAIIFNHTDTDFELASNLSGSATLRQIGSGTTTLSGSSGSFSGTTSVEAGTLIVNGVLGGRTDVGAARLGGSGIVNNVTLGNGAVISPGSGAGVAGFMIVGGDLTFEAGSTYEVDRGAASADRISVGGTAYLNDGASVAHIGNCGPYPWYERHSILFAFGGIDGTFGSVTSDYAFLTPDLSYDAQNVYLSLVRNDIDFISVTRGANQSGVAGALNGFTLGNPIYDQIVAMTEEEARAAFDALSGEAYASGSAASLQSVQQIRDLLQARLQMFSGANVASAGFVPAAGDAVAGDAPAVWGQLFSARGENDATATSAAIDRRSTGFIGGVDVPVGAVSRVGVALGYSRSDFDVSARASSGEADNFHLVGYAGTEIGFLDLDATAGYSYGRAQAERTVVVGLVTNNLSADYDTHTFQASLEAGTDIDAGPVTLTPFAGIGVTHVRTDGFTETGGPAALSFASSDNTTGTSSLGLRVGHRAGEVELTGSAAWRHTFGDVEPASRAAFASAPAAPFTVRGTAVAENALALGGDIAFGVSEGATLTLGYAGEYSSESRDHGLRTEVRIEF